jgi:hypothetical protein
MEPIIPSSFSKDDRSEKQEDSSLSNGGSTDSIIPSSFGKDDRGEKKGDLSPLRPLMPRKTDAQYLEELRALQTNFLFLYGDTQAGKSAICASLIYYLMTNPDVGKFTERGQASESGQDFIRRSISKVSQKRFLERTPKETVSLAGGRFEPQKKRFRPIPLTFMEMAGEDLRTLVAPTEANGFPQHIDVYLNDSQLNLIFVLVVRHDTVSHEKDLMMADFIDYLRSKDESFTNAKILLLVSQWDSYKGDKQIREFVREFLPLTYAALSYRESAISAYSVGNVSMVDSEPFIKRLDKESPARLIRWIYKTVTGLDFMRESKIDRLVKLFR